MIRLPFRFFRAPPLLFSVAVATFLVLALGTSAHAADQLYTCGMHPQIIRHEPGNCPICGMKLVPVRANTPGSATAPRSASSPPGPRSIKYYRSTMRPGEVSPTPAKDSMGMDMVPVYNDPSATMTAGDAGATLHIDARTIQRMNLKTALVGHGPVRREIHAVGTIAYDESGLRDVTTKFGGWIETLRVNATGAVVKAGDPLLELYSPELYNAQLNALVALRSEGAGGGPLTRASLERLKLLGVTPGFIATLTPTATASRTYTVRAPAGGTVIEKNVVAGQMIQPGERLYRLADLSSVWVLARIHESDIPFVHENQSAAIERDYGPKETFAGRVARLLPQLDDQTRTATARIVLPNPGLRLRPGMFVEVRLAVEVAADAVLVPDLAVLRSGERDTVFVALPGGAFEPRTVTLGARTAANDYEVRSGLAAGERIVVSGQFLLDSESQLREGIQKMLNAPPAAGEAGAAPHEPARPHAR
jgi:multidrug efflux pump subunit AcrA (membrane-fusion protein)